MTRYVSGMEGRLAVQTGAAGERMLVLTDLHGDVMATLPIADGAGDATWTSLVYRVADELGNPTESHDRRPADQRRQLPVPHRV